MAYHGQTNLSSTTHDATTLQTYLTLTDESFSSTCANTSSASLPVSGLKTHDSVHAQKSSAQRGSNCHRPYSLNALPYKLPSTPKIWPSHIGFVALLSQLPHTRHRWEIATLLKEREDYLWPLDEQQGATTTAHTAEIVAAYAHRAHVPMSAWWKLFTQAERQIDLLGFAMLFLPEQHPELVDLLKDKAAHGCQVRITVSDPTSPYVHDRDQEEQLKGTLPARIQATLQQFRELHHHPNIHLHFHRTPMYNSVFRGDDEMFVTTHLFGLHGSKAPLLHLRRLGPHGIFADFAEHFENLWATTTPVETIAQPDLARQDILPEPAYGK